VFWFSILFFSALVTVVAVRGAELAVPDAGSAPPRHGDASSGPTESARLLAADTRVRSPIRTLVMVTMWDLAYELSRRLHQAANSGAERFGPMRISPWQ
jgi:hypothetical protein